MAYSVLQSKSASSISAGTTVAATFTTANVQAATKLIALVSWTGNGLTTASVKDAALNAMTKIQVAQLNAGSGGEISMWAMDTPAGDVGSKPTITATGGSTADKAILVQEVSGLAVGNTLAAMVDGTASNNSGIGGSSAASGAYSSTAALEYLLSMYADDGGPETWVKPTGSTSDANSLNSNSNTDIAAAWKDSANGAESMPWALSGTSADWGVILVAFKLAAVVAGIPPIYGYGPN
jgi:hypothetical protein